MPVTGFTTYSSPLSSRCTVGFTEPDLNCLDGEPFWSLGWVAVNEAAYCSAEIGTCPVLGNDDLSADCVSVLSTRNRLIPRETHMLIGFILCPLSCGLSRETKCGTGSV